MTRRKQYRDEGSPLDLLFDVAVMLPWWANICGAIISYFLFDYIKLRDYTADPISAAFYPLIAMFAQYTLTAVFSIAAMVSSFRELAKQKKGNPTQIDLEINSTLELLANISWEKFERLIGQYFEKEGYTVNQKGGAHADGGIDIELHKDGNLYLVQCKHYFKSKMPIGEPIVRDLYGAVNKQGAFGGFIVTSSRFTPQAKAYVEGINMTLIDGEMLSRIIKVQMPVISLTGGSPSAQPSAQDLAPAHVSVEVAESPICPLCSSNLIKGTAKHGKYKGKDFWGCSTYPKCKGIINI